MVQNGIQVDSLPKQTKFLLNCVFQKEVLKEYKVNNLTELLGYSNALIHELFQEMHMSEIAIPSEVMTLVQAEKTK